ncbi:MAG: TetR/AcrR family transcriptional regulator [Coriobacteriaceae bacterium]|nr:TetR/AcrR family transcriptional regulator [Coriobacteriaceae bacterium]
MNKQPAVTEQTRANLREAFWSLYLEKPIDKITIREITDRAGYNRATFYLYYRDVYDLFGQIEDEVLEGVRALVDEELLRDRTLDISQHMGRIIQLTQRNGYALPHLMGPHGDPGFSQRLKEILAPLFDRFILDGQDLTDQQRAIMREFYASGVLAAIGTWMTAADSMPVDQLVELIVGALLAR